MAPRCIKQHHSRGPVHEEGDMKSLSWRPVVDNQRSRPEVMLQEMTSRYAGHVVVGRDLDVY